jgi:hypothetical protein
MSGGGLGFLYMVHFVSALPNATPHHEFKGLRPENPLSDALELMRRDVGAEAVEEVLILDDSGMLCGVVTKKDLLREAQQAHPEIALNWTRLLESSHWLPQKSLKE